jgi:hypothetical protein
MLHVGPMENHTYRRPTTGRRVQGLVRGSTHSTDDAAYETVTCLVCNGVHLVSLSSGRVLGADRTPDTTCLVTRATSRH